jgi:hypothetical protein
MKTLRLLAACTGFALAGGLLASSAQAAPASTQLATVKVNGLEMVHYDNYWRPRPWWHYNRWDRPHFRWWWWKKPRRHDWSWNRDHRRDGGWDDRRDDHRRDRRW